MSKKKKPRRLKRRLRAQTDTKKQPTSKYREGDAVRVKPGTVCPDAPTLDLSGWQGRVTDLTHANVSDPTIGFTWDSISLRAIPARFIEDAERNGLDWSTMYLGLDDVEPAEPRDTKPEVAQAQEEIATRFGWLDMGPEGERIQGVVNTAPAAKASGATTFPWPIWPPSTSTRPMRSRPRTTGCGLPIADTENLPGDKPAHYDSDDSVTRQRATARVALGVGLPGAGGERHSR